MRSLVVIAHNLRSAHNVGSLLRTAEGLGVAKVYLTGYTPYPLAPHDERLPHLAQKVDQQIAKTALGAEKSLAWSHQADIDELITRLKHDNYSIAGLEQAPHSVPPFQFKAPEKLALIIGRETEGIEPELLQQCGSILEIPMLGRKESFNVVQAAAMALYELRFHP